MSIAAKGRRGVASRDCPGEPFAARTAHAARTSAFSRLLAAYGYRVSMICLDYGQPQKTVMHGITVHKDSGPRPGYPYCASCIRV
jgi:hypothetical protein